MKGSVQKALAVSLEPRQQDPSLPLLWAWEAQVAVRGPACRPHQGIRAADRPPDLLLVGGVIRSRRA